MARQFIYHMQGLTKAYSGSKKVLENVNLSFYPDAKIGVLGPERLGQVDAAARSWPGSTRNSAARPGSPRARPSATCAQEPQLDPTQDVLGNVMEGVAKKKAILDRYNELMMNYSDETADEATKLQDEIDARTSGTSTARSRWRWKRSAARPATPTSTQLSGGEKRRVALCKLLLSAARPAAARRADQPSRRRDDRLAGKAPARVSGRGADRHPRPLLPRQRHRLDPRARSRPRHPLRGQLLRLSREEGQAHGAGRPRGRRPPARARPRARVDRGQPQGPPDQVEGPHPGL